MSCSARPRTSSQEPSFDRSGGIGSAVQHLSALRLSRRQIGTVTGCRGSSQCRRSSRSRPSVVAVFVSQTGASRCDGTQHLLRLSLRVAEGADARPRGLETQSCPCTGLLMTGDVTMVRPLSPGSGKGPRQTGPRGAARRGWASHHPRGAAGRGVEDHGPRSKRMAYTIRSDSVLRGST